MVATIKITEKHRLRLENFTLKHIMKNMVGRNKVAIVHEVKKTHHQLIKRKVREDDGDNIVDKNAHHTYYSVGELLKHHGYFMGGLPDFSQEEKDGTTIEYPYHKIRKTWIRNLSVKLSTVYKKKYEELPPIGYGKVSSNSSKKPINNRTNLYTTEPEYKDIIIEFMKEHPENKWFETTTLVDERTEKRLTKSKEVKQRNKKRVESYLEVKEYLTRRIKKSKEINDEDKSKMLKEYYALVETCKKELPKNTDMNVLFMNFKSKHGL